MKITVESTTKMVEFNGVPCRVWEGTTASGIKMHCFIVRVAVHKDDDAAEFERELQEVAPPTPEINDVYPLRMIL